MSTKKVFSLTIAITLPEQTTKVIGGTESLSNL